MADAAHGCFPCEGYFICGGDVTTVTLTPQADGC